MITLIWIGGLIVLVIVFLLMRHSGGSKSPGPGNTRFHHPGPGEAKPKVPRAPGLD